VEIGGEVRCQGRGPGGRAWRIAVERPQTGARTVQAGVALDGLGISTSGDYRDFRVLEGRRISHTIDPRSGHPVTHALASVSVVHRSVMLADAYATALLVLGPQEGYALAERLELPALFIVRVGDGFTVRATESFDRLRLPAAD
jgi:FAD:protein FMN transferase